MAGKQVTLIAGLERWEQDQLEIVRCMRDFKGDAYKTGFTDGMECAVTTIREYLTEAMPGTVTGADEPD